MSKNKLDTFSLNIAVARFLKENPEHKFTAREIAEWVQQKYPKECQEKLEKSKNIKDETSLRNQLVAEIGSHRFQIQKKHPKVKTTEERPRKYYYTDKDDTEEIEKLKVETDERKTLESDLYPLLTNFLHLEHGIYSKRIDERRSSNNHGPRGNKWLYPDIVAMENLSSDWDREVKDCVKQYADKKTKLWSFEVKVSINKSNIRKSFFQAVSNSSWANLGYLAATEIREDAMKELRILSSLHGIGFILLNVDDPTESQIMIPAKERDDIDWDTVNRLAEENKDFKHYVKSIRQFNQTDEVKNSDWDFKE